MKNEMLERLWIGPNPTAWGALSFHTSPEIKSGVEFVRADLTDRRTDVDALIEAVEKDKRAHSVDPVYDANVAKAIQAIRGKRDE